MSNKTRQLTLAEHDARQAGLDELMDHPRFPSGAICIDFTDAHWDYWAVEKDGTLWHAECDTLIALGRDLAAAEDIDWDDYDFFSLIDDRPYDLATRLVDGEIPMDEIDPELYDALREAA